MGRIYVREKSTNERGLSNHSFLVYTIDVSVILSVVLPRLSGENNAQHDRYYTMHKVTNQNYLIARRCHRWD